MDDFGVPLYAIIKDVASNNSSLIIPLFQRPYAWPAQKAVQMLDLLWGHSQRVAPLPPAVRPPLFLGSVILARNGASDLLIVDGQQRITSFVLLLAAARRCFLRLKNPALTTRLYETWRDDTNANFSVKLWGRNFALDEEDEAVEPIFVMQNLVQEMQSQWQGLFDKYGDPTVVSPAAAVPPNNQYSANFQALYVSLDSKLQALGTEALQREALAKLGTFVISHAKVLKAIAPSLSSAYEDFRIAAIPGEPLDVATIFKHRLSTNVQDPSGVFETFALAAPSRDVAKDERVIKTVLRVVMRVTDVDEEIVRVVGGGLLPFEGADAVAQRTFRSKFCDLLELHANLELLKKPAAAPVSPLQQAVQKLFQLEESCSRSNRDTGLTIPGEDDTLWRSVAIKLFKSLRISVLERPGDNPQISCDPGGVDDIATATRALVDLERLLLCHSLHAIGHGAKVETSMGRILSEVDDAEGAAVNFMPLMAPSAGQIQAAIAALDRPLYSRGVSRVSALRYLLAQCNALWHMHEDNAQINAMPAAEDLRFRKDWTVEHIYAQNADPALAPRGHHEWFNDLAFSRLHCLGNLLPLHPDLQATASNHAFDVKRLSAYAASHNVLSRAASRLAGFVSGVSTQQQRAAFELERTYLPVRFVQRHVRIKALIARHIFGQEPGALRPLFDDLPGDGGGGALAEEEGQPPRQRARIAVFVLPPEYQPLTKRQKEEAYVAALNNIVVPGERERLRDAIGTLQRHAMGRQPTSPPVMRFHFFSGINGARGSSYILNTRRIEIVKGFFEGRFTLAEIEAAAVEDPAAAFGGAGGAGAVGEGGAAAGGGAV